jgi:hypothetical protein
VVVLLEFCAAQRTEHGGLSAEVMRGDIAEQSGLTIDRVDDCNRVLQQAGLLEITRRRATNGGRHLPSVYTIHEAPGGKFQGGESELAERQNGTGRAEEEHQQGGVPVPPGPVNGTDRAAFRYRQGGDPAMAGTASPPSNARACLNAEKDIESVSSFDDGVVELGERGEGTISSEELCEALIAAWEPALGAAPRGDYVANRGRWLDAAASVLDRHTGQRLEQALAYMVTDEILGSQALTMPGFAKVADQLIARAYARQQRRATRSTPGPSTGELGWEDAKQRLQRAIQRHGREGREGAVRELREQSPLLARFVERARWGSLCEEPFQYVERRYAELWRELVEQVNEQGEERVA